MKIPPTKLVIITVVGALITVLFERMGVYDAIYRAIPKLPAMR